MTKSTLASWTLQLAKQEDQIIAFLSLPSTNVTFIYGNEEYQIINFWKTLYATGKPQFIKKGTLKTLVR